MTQRVISLPNYIGLISTYISIPEFISVTLSFIKVQFVIILKNKKKEKTMTLYHNIDKDLVLLELDTFTLCLLLFVRRMKNVRQYSGFSEVKGNKM